MKISIKKNLVICGLLAVILVLGLLLGINAKAPIKQVYATDTYVLGSELKIETIIGGTHSTTFAGGKYLHLDPIDKNHYTNSVSANADMEYDETTGVLKIFKTDNTDDNFYRYISIIATNTTAKKLTIKAYFSAALYVLDFPNGDLTITNGEGVYNAGLACQNKISITGKLTICGEIVCSFSSTSVVGLYPDSNSWVSANELEILDSAALRVMPYSSNNTYTCAVNVGYLTLNTDGYLMINANGNTNNSFTYVLYVAYQVNFTKCLYLALSSPLDTVASLTNSTYLKNAVDTAPIEGYDAVINRVKTGKYGDYGEDLYRREYELSRLLNVTYNSNGGTGTMNSEDVRYNGKLTLPACTFTAPAGQQFAGWAVGSASATPLRTPSMQIQIKEPTVIYAVWEAAPAEELSGTVSINGALKFGETLTANVASNNTGTLSYVWRRNGENIAGAINSTYQVVADDIGYTLSVVVSSSVETGSIIATATSVIDKADQSAPTGIEATACTTDANNDGTLTGLSTAMQYKLSTSEIWLDVENTTITGLTNGTYNVRYKETATHKAGQVLNIEVNAFNAPTKYAITVVDGGASVISAEQGTTITITADEAPAGYVFDRWVSEDGVEFADANSAETTFVLPNKNVTIEAKYIPIKVDPEIEPKPEPKNNGGLSAGAIVAIVLASVVVASAGGFAIFWFVIKKKTWADFVALFKKK